MCLPMRWKVTCAIVSVYQVLSAGKLRQSFEENNKSHIPVLPQARRLKYPELTITFLGKLLM